MRLWLALLLLIPLSIGGLIYYQCTQNRRNEANVKQKQASQIVVPPAVHQPQTQNEHTDTYDASKDCLYRLYLCATIAGFFVALGGIYTIYKQTEATMESARASKQSADTLANVERPWIQVIVSQPNERNRSQLLFEMVNKGKTPAQIISHTVKRTRKQSCDDMPVPPNYGKFEEIDIVSLLPPKEPRRIASFTISDEIKGPDIQEHWPHIFYGIVRYKNVISDKLPAHETRFCFGYSYNPQVPWVEPWPCGPEEYNRNT